MHLRKLKPWNIPLGLNPYAVGLGLLQSVFAVAMWLCSSAGNTVWRYRKHLLSPEELISLFECELNVCSGQSLHKWNTEARRTSDMQVHASAGILIFPQRVRLWPELKDEPLHISAVMNINDPPDLLKLHIKGHITPLKNKLYTLSLKMALAEWETRTLQEFCPVCAKTEGEQRVTNKSRWHRYRVEKACKDNFCRLQWLLAREMTLQR